MQARRSRRAAAAAAGVAHAAAITADTITTAPSQHARQSAGCQAGVQAAVVPIGLARRGPGGARVRRWRGRSGGASSSAVARRAAAGPQRAGELVGGRVVGAGRGIVVPPAPGAPFKGQQGPVRARGRRPARRRRPPIRGRVVHGAQEGGRRRQAQGLGDGGRRTRPGQLSGGRVQDGDVRVQAAQGFRIKVEELCFMLRERAREEWGRGWGWWGEEEARGERVWPCTTKNVKHALTPGRSATDRAPAGRRRPGGW